MKLGFVFCIGTIESRIPFINSFSNCRPLLTPLLSCPLSRLRTCFPKREGTRYTILNPHLRYFPLFIRHFPTLFLFPSSTLPPSTGSETDRQKVLMQIVQELCKRPGLNKTGFDMPTIYVPTLAGDKAKCVNQIEEV